MTVGLDRRPRQHDRGGLQQRSRLDGKVGGNTYKGNVFKGAYSITGGSADAHEQRGKRLSPAGVSGPFTVTVTAANINSVGVPNADNLANQDFALVVYNAGAAPALAAGGAILTHESCTPANGVIDPEETVTVQFTIENAGPASTTNLLATLLAGNGVAFPHPGPQNYGALAAGAAGHSRLFVPRPTARAARSSPRRCNSGRRGGPGDCQL